METMMPPLISKFPRTKATSHIDAMAWSIPISSASFKIQLESCHLVIGEAQPRLFKIKS
jgi:hypothetical protein